MPVIDDMVATMEMLRDNDPEERLRRGGMIHIADQLRAVRDREARLQGDLVTALMGDDFQEVDAAATRVSREILIVAHLKLALKEPLTRALMTLPPTPFGIRIRE